MSFLKRFSYAWYALLGRPTPETLAAIEQITALETRLERVSGDLRQAELRMDRSAARMTELERLVLAAQGDPLEEILVELAVPMSQLRMQASLIEGGRDISGRSVMALTRQIIERLESAGLEPIGEVGQEVSFDPQLCEALSADARFIRGDFVVIRFVGYRYRGSILRKALVERTTDA